jgi:hypothetical protein
MKFSTTILLVLLSFQIELNGQNSTISDTISKEESIEESVTFEKQPLMIFDDKIIESSKELNEIDPNTIQELTVYKVDLDKFVKQYGEKAENGIIFIYSKHYIAHKWFINFASFSKRFQKSITNKDYNYLDFKVLLNKEQLKADFINDLDKKMDSMVIKKIKFKKPKYFEKGGIIKIKTKKIK